MSWPKKVTTHARTVQLGLPDKYRLIKELIVFSTFDKNDAYHINIISEMHENNTKWLILSCRLSGLLLSCSN